MKKLDMKKVDKVKKKDKIRQFRNTTLKVCDFHITNREKYEKEKLHGK